MSSGINPNKEATAVPSIPGTIHINVDLVIGGANPRKGKEFVWGVGDPAPEERAEGMLVRGGDEGRMVDLHVARCDERRERCECEGKWEIELRDGERGLWRTVGGMIGSESRV